MSPNFLRAQNLAQKSYPRLTSEVLRYGTSGFRANASKLGHVTFRMGLLAALRSRAKEGSTVGAMVTASHNPEEDNGVKLCDPDGTMLEPQWEEFATSLINVDDDALAETLTAVLQSCGINDSLPSNVFVARDTRSSSERLSDALVAGVLVMGGQVKDFGLLTTPQLHFVVYCKNHPSYGAPTQAGYYEKLSKAFLSLTANSKAVNQSYIARVHIDGSNGIGALKLMELQKYLPSLELKIFNDSSKGTLNYKCGADYVKIGQKPPEGCDVPGGERCASLDGDADRIVYFYQDSSGAFHLLDGDKIATLVAIHLKKIVWSTGLSLQMRVVQTAYANGSATRYIQDTVGIPVICVPTGVKHLHHEASKYDVGIYFEANGHGTVVFQEAAKSRIRGLASSTCDDDTPKIAAAKKLLSTIDVINESVGDAISDLLLIEAILQDLDWNIEKWDSLYSDLPSRQLKVKISDRHAILTADAERRCTQPKGLQAAIDASVSKRSSGRCFIRPSGTEDVVRVYAEAGTQVEADELAEEVSRLVVQFVSA